MISNRHKTSSPREHVRQELKRRIDYGQITAGALLPGEDKLAEEFQIARGTVRSALDLLEVDGLVEKRGRRRYVVQKLDDNRIMSNLILFIGTQSANPQEFMNTEFEQAKHAGAIERLGELGKHVMVVQFNRLNAAELDNLVRLRPAGAIVTQKVTMDNSGQQILEQLQQARIPVVLEYGDNQYAEFDRVLFDQESGNYELTHYAIEQGFRKILCFYPDQTREYWYNARHRGYRRAMNEAGLTPLPPIKGNPKIPHEKYTQADFDFLVRLNSGFMLDYLTPELRPDCILAPTDWEVPIIAAGCRMLGFTPGRDLHFIGFDNKESRNPWACFEDTRPLATVTKHNTNFGKILADTLIERLEGKLTAEPVIKLVKTDLLVL